MKIFFAMILAFVFIFNITPVKAQEIFEHSVGEYKIYFLPENQMTGNTDILLNASPDVINKYFDEKNFPMYLNTFLVQGPKHTVLIDGGFGNKLFEHLATLKIHPTEVDVVLLTHMHGDHIGGLLKDDKAAFNNATLWLAEQEHAYWSSEDEQNALPKAKQQGFAKAQKLLAAYGDKVQTFNPLSIDKQKDYLLDGIKAIEIFGHTPGHTAFLVGEGKDALLIWADLVHVEKIQLAMPEVALVFDVDPKQAVATRLKLMDYVAKNNIKVSGMHIGQKGAVELKKQGNGYEFVQAKP